MKLLIGILGLLAIGGTLMAATSSTRTRSHSESDSGVYAFNLTRIDGTPLPLSQYKGKILLIVNVASKCGFTSQYKDLEQLYQIYKDKNLVVIGIPANNFANQEPGSNSSIQEFCSVTYGVSFPMSEKVSVRGDAIHPLYRYLTAETSNLKARGPINWNFNKFLIDQSGHVVKRYGSMVNPMSDTVCDDINGLIAK